jgi:hypothetical protein
MTGPITAQPDREGPVLPQAGHCGICGKQKLHWDRFYLCTFFYIRIVPSVLHLIQVTNAV